MHIYRGFRSVRGDGECWYRCVGFYVVESALTNRTNWDRLTSRLRCTPRLVSHLQQSDRENFEQGLRWLDRISCDATYDICQLEEDLCTGLSQGVPIDIDLFITQSVTLNCIEAIELADLPLQTLICAEHGGEYVTDDLDKLYTHVLYGKDISGHRIWATEHVGKLGMYSRFGLSAQVETMLSDSTQTIDVQEPQDDTVAHIVLFHHHNHYDILYADESCHDYKQVWKVSCCMDEYRTRLLGPYPDRHHRHKYLSSAIIDGTLSNERQRSTTGIHIFDSSLGDAMLTENRSKCERMLQAAAISLETQTLLIPINISNVHYVLAIVDIRSETVWLYDPLGENEANLIVAEKICVVIGRHLRRPFDSKLFQGPIQRNPYDCGTLVIAVAVTISRGQPVVSLTAAECQQMREQIWQILLRSWWQQQRVKGTENIHRARGVEPALDVNNTERILIDITAASNSTSGEDGAERARQKQNSTEDQHHSASAGARGRPSLGEQTRDSRIRTQRDNDMAGPRPSNSKTQHRNVHKQPTQTQHGCVHKQPTQDDDIAQGASIKNATSWWRRGSLAEPSYKIRNPSTGQGEAEGSISTLGLGMPSGPQLEESQDTTAEVDSILHSNPHGDSKTRAQRDEDIAGPRPSNSKTQHNVHKQPTQTQHGNVHKQPTQADDIAQGASIKNATWWRRGSLAEPSYKIRNPSNGQEEAEGSISTLGLRMPSGPQLKESQDTTAEVDSILYSHPHDPGD